MSPADTVPLALVTGLAAGATHVLTGPDHLAAVLPFASEARRRAAWTGLAWGAGHSIGVLLLGGLAITLQGAVNVEGVSTWAEGSVGFLLIGLGLWTLRRAGLVVVHAHPHRHDDGAGDHAHPHVHIADATVGRPDHAERGAHRRHQHSALAFGVVHGVAGTSHLFGVVPALVLGTAPALAYLAAFLVGSAGAMAGCAAFAGGLVGGHPGRLRLGLRLSGSLAVVVGGVWIFQTVTQGLA